MSDARLFSAASERNREPILSVLREVLPPSGTVLEIASGTGMHAVHFARALPALRWQPTDIDAGALSSIEAWRQAEGLGNLLPPLSLDVLSADWPVNEVSAIYNANMIHISPPECAEGLLKGASALLPPGAPLVIYGPFRIGGQHTAPSNAQFDETLRTRDPRWGVRDLEAIEALARAHALPLARRVEMPANNQILIFRKRDAS